MIVLIITNMLAGYAALGIMSSGKNSDRPHRALLSQKSSLKPGTFSLKSGYVFRGGQLVTTQQSKYINLNTVATYSVGGTVYSVPLKKQFLLNGKLSMSNLNEASR